MSLEYNTLRFIICGVCASVILSYIITDMIIILCIFKTLPLFFDIKTGGAMKIDVWRILVVYMFGGIYCDADIGPTKSMTEESPITDGDDAFFLSDGVSSICHIYFSISCHVMFITIPPQGTNCNLFYHVISHFHE